MIQVIDLRSDHMEIVDQILAEYVPDCEVYAFGSRVRGKVKPHSDLDLVVRGHAPLSWKRLGLLQEAFAESDLPIRVDVLDWHTISEKFRQLIERDWVLISIPRLAHKHEAEI